MDTTDKLLQECEGYTRYCRSEERNCKSCILIKKLIVVVREQKSELEKAKLK